MQTLISIEQREQMIQNGLQTQKDHIGNHWPVVKLFTPDANCTWLLSELDPEEPDIAFGLCDLGLGFPEIGSVRISEITSVRGRLGLPVEQDLSFQATKSLLDYANDARAAGRIVEFPVINDDTSNELLDEIKSDVGDLVHYSTHLGQLIYEHQLPLERLKSSDDTSDPSEIYAKARDVAEPLSFAALVVYISAFADALEERLMA